MFSNKFVENQGKPVDEVRMKIEQFLDVKYMTVHTGDFKKV